MSAPGCRANACSGLFIIDPKGILRQITINDLPVGRSVDETLRLVQAFQYTDSHGEGAFPAPHAAPPSDQALIRSPTACFVSIQSARRAGSQDRPRYASWSAAHTRPTMLTALPMFSLSPHADQARPARKAVVLQDDQGRVLDGLRSQACSSKRPAHPPRYTCFCLYTLRIQKKQ